MKVGSYFLEEEAKLISNKYRKMGYIVTINKNNGPFNVNIFDVYAYKTKQPNKTIIKVIQHDSKYAILPKNDEKKYKDFKGNWIDELHTETTLQGCPHEYVGAAYDGVKQTCKLCGKKRIYTISKDEGRQFLGE